MHAVEVGLLETNGKPSLGRRGRQVVVVRADQPGQDGSVAGVGVAGFDGHKPGYAVGLRNGSACILAEAGVIGNMTGGAVGSGIDQAEPKELFQRIAGGEYVARIAG